MIIKAKNNREVLLRKLGAEDLDKLAGYLQHLSPESKMRFGPHPSDISSVTDIYTNRDDHTGYIALDTETGGIVAYSVIKRGSLDHDRQRLQSYNLTLDPETDCTFAPSVADEWQSLGIGNNLFQFILSELKFAGIKRIILWGGVQCENHKAVNFYKKNDFRILGQFEYNGLNYDMVLDIG